VRHARVAELAYAPDLGSGPARVEGSSPSSPTMDAEFEKLREGFPVWMTLPIQWGDPDAFGHFNKTVYFRWFESARIAYADRIDLSDSDVGSNIDPILAAISCRYLQQLKYPDTVHVGARISEFGRRSSMTMQHLIISEQLRAIVAEGDSTLV